MPTFIDQTGNRIKLNKCPKRIISLVPSQSEFLWDLGLKDELVGITKFCIHPHVMFKSIERVGGTKKLNLKKIRELKPDLIIGNKEENEKEQIELLQKEFNVWMSDIYNFKDALKMMRSIGKITGREKESEKILTGIKESLPGIKNMFKKQTVVYLIWNKPYMLAGKNTFIDAVINYSGLINGVHHLNRYPELSIEQLRGLNPEYCFLSTEPFPFKEKHVTELQKLLPDSIVKIVDGEMFSWYGSRLAKLPAYLKNLRENL